MIFYIENPKDSTRKLLELINDYSKVAGYKINTQKSLAFLYTNNEKTEREIKETIPYTTLILKEGNRSQERVSFPHSLASKSGFGTQAISLHGLFS